MTNPFRPRYFLPGLAAATTPQKDVAPASSVLATPGNGPIAGFTNTFSLNLVNFDWITWHNYEWENWIVVDALLNAAIGFLNIKGFWKPSTDYLAGQSVFDPDNVSRLYLCLSPHTSSTDFEADKPLYWKLVDQAKPPVNSVFGRIGDVLADAADYAMFYADKAATAAHIARTDNPHGTSWNSLLNKPATFPPAVHTHVEADITNLDKYSKAQVDAIDAATRAAFAAADVTLQTDINSRLPKAGGTMTGFLTLSANPSALLHAATKGYVDSIDTAIRSAFAAADTSIRNDFAAADAGLQTQIDSKLPLAGGTLTGFLSLHAMPTAALHAASKSYVDQAIAALPPGSGVVISDTAPANPQPGQLWYRVVAPVGMFVWYNDGDSSQWVQVAGGAIAQSGEQNIDTAGQTQVVFDQVPSDAVSLALSFSNVTFSGGNAILDFLGAATADLSTLRQIAGAAYAAPASQSATEIELDNIGGTSGFIGTYFFERIPYSNNVVWVMSGSHRRGNSLVTHAGARLILNQSTMMPLRIRASAGTFATNQIICRWRR
jgi:hypothetical protein